MSDIVKILFADDDSEDRFIMGDAFNEAGLANAVHFVENGEHVLLFIEEAYKKGALPSLIVLDLNMPRMNGTQTLRILKADERYSAIPVIIFSTSVNGIEMKECMELGATAYITKPVTYKECLDTARKFYEFSSTNELSLIS